MRCILIKDNLFKIEYIIKKPFFVSISVFIVDASNKRIQKIGLTSKVVSFYPSMFYRFAGNKMRFYGLCR